MSDCPSLETLTAQGLGWVDRETGSIVPPLYPSTNFERNPDLSFNDNRVYTRADNPTYRQASALLARLESGCGAQLFSSGMAAVVALFQALRPGDHVILPESLYFGVRKWVLNYTSLRAEFVPNEDLDALQRALRPGVTRLVWIETPSNPMWCVTDIAAAAEIAHQAGALVAVDNTVPTPVLTRPLELGADIVMHAGTKYLNGHGDVLLGALVARENNELWTAIHEIAHDGGALPGTFETWLLLRGMRTLFVRMERICASAMAVAQHFHGHPKLLSVLYPGLPDCVGHDVAVRQMTGGFGGMLSIRVRGGREGAVRVQAGTKIFKRATSFGGTDSLIEHRASYEPPDSPVPQDLLRLSIGLESVSDLIADLEQALESA